MNAPVFMSWLDRLPEVGAPILNERDRLEAMLAEAEAFERRAAELRASARAGRAGLLGKVAKLWSLYEIQRAGDAEDASFHNVQDHELRGALRALDGVASPLDILEAFHKGRVIRQHNLFSTATDEDRHATLHRVLDWWNYGAAPVLSRSQG